MRIHQVILKIFGQHKIFIVSNSRNTSGGALAGTRNSSMGPPHEGSIRLPIAPRKTKRVRTLVCHCLLPSEQTAGVQRHPFLLLLKLREREIFYLTMHSTHFIYGYMASDIWLRTILIVRKETSCCHIGYSF